jgi:cyclopropane-fatty-acyl-phospholipid synthase
MQAQFDRVVRAMERRRAALETGLRGSAFALRLPDRSAVTFGTAEPRFTLVVNDMRGLAALATMDTTAAGEAYLHGSIDVEGNIYDVLSMRQLFSDRHPLRYAARFVRPLLRGQIATDRKNIALHYDEDPDFFLLFLDSRHRAYSQGVHAHDEEPLEDAISRKLDFAWNAVGLKEGDRVLDIGGGWGAFTEYGGRRGARVTSLTISEQSERFINKLIREQGLPSEVRREHLFEHRPAQPYDAIVNLGVTEHLPDYPRTLACYDRLLKPGGSIYLDASAARRKHEVSDFFERHIYRGNGSQMVLHEYLDAVSASRFEVDEVYNDRHDYMLTTRWWASNLDEHRATIEERWGKTQYRRFQLYLWGCVDGFARDILQAYRLVLRKPFAA